MSRSGGSSIFAPVCRWEAAGRVVQTTLTVVRTCRMVSMCQRWEGAYLTHTHTHCAHWWVTHTQTHGINCNLCPPPTNNAVSQWMTSRGNTRGVHCRRSLSADWAEPAQTLYCDSLGTSVHNVWENSPLTCTCTFSVQIFSPLLFICCFLHEEAQHVLFHERPVCHMQYSIAVIGAEMLPYLSAALKMPLAAWALSSGGQEERKMSSSFIIERMLEADTKAKESSKARLDGRKRW